MLLRNDLVGQLQIEASECLHGIDQLRFNQPAHLEHVGHNAMKISVELAGCVFVCHANILLNRRQNLNVDASASPRMKNRELDLAGFWWPASLDLLDR